MPHWGKIPDVCVFLVTWLDHRALDTASTARTILWYLLVTKSGSVVIEEKGTLSIPSRRWKIRVSVPVPVSDALLSI